MASSLEALAPGFLIAAPSLRDPNFDHTVVLMCVHNDQGAMGLIVNREAPITVGDIVRQLDLAPSPTDAQQVMLGGPVALESALLLYRPDAGEEPRDDELQVADQLRLCSGQEVLRAVAADSGPPAFHVFLGHSGWGPGQLEQELALGAWIPASLRLELIFDAPVEERWDGALRAEGLNPAALGTFRPQN